MIKFSIKIVNLHLRRKELLSYFSLSLFFFLLTSNCFLSGDVGKGKLITLSIPRNYKGKKMMKSDKTLIKGNKISQRQNCIYSVYIKSEA